MLYGTTSSIVNGRGWLCLELIIDFFLKPFMVVYLFTHFVKAKRFVYLQWKDCRLRDALDSISFFFPSLCVRCKRRLVQNVVVLKFCVFEVYIKILSICYSVPSVVYVAACVSVYLEQNSTHKKDTNEKLPLMESENLHPTFIYSICFYCIDLPTSIICVVWIGKDIW